MKIQVKRQASDGVCTLGELYVDGGFECFTLEDPVRDEKIWGQTAIPAGTYQVTITFSPHFQRDLPLVNDVPDYSGVRIHPGNTAADTEGCLLVGEHMGKDAITQSRDAFNALFPKIKAALDAGDGVTIEYNNHA